MRRSILAGSSILASLATAKSTLRNRDNGTMIYDFSSLEPSIELQWTPCHDNFTCTYLEVPLDYEDPSVGTTALAFIKWSSTNSSGTQDIIVNPGGPGGSGVQYLIQALPTLHLGLGTQNNIISFDPRGVKNSRLNMDLSCFPGRHGTSRLYAPDFFRVPNVDSTESLATVYAQAGAFGQWCNEAHAAENDTAKYANTVATATDMLHFTELLAESNGQSKDESKLWFYGASYGTVLGATFASLFPDRVGRMILDGVLDGEDYYQGKWANNLADSDKAINSFFELCYEGGGEACVFWDESIEAMEARYAAIVSKMQAAPIIYADPTQVGRPIVLTIAEFKSAVAGSSHAPSVSFPMLAAMLVQIEQGDGQLLAALSGEVDKTLDTCGETPLTVEDIEPRQIIACVDANRRFNLSSFDEYVEHAHYLVNQSSYLGEAWAAITAVNCRSLNITAPESQIFHGAPSADETFNPILFIGNTADPVTPLASAKKMSEFFGGSGLLTQNSVGHSSFSQFSACTVEYTRMYMESGELPPEGTVCEVDEIAFQPFEMPL